MNAKLREDIDSMNKDGIINKVQNKIDDNDNKAKNSK